MSTLHLLQNTAQGGTYDEFYLIKNGKLFRILVEPEDNPTSSSHMHQNLNLKDSSKWYNTFLQSFKFTK
ncbi:MAG: hypothetical protein A3J47_00490 [Candidatus Yanofskybacteria bacterium RIFCSPHIGHO2_02_FULL_43_22]|uniref:Uncharacterized protein n=1 Tax=Candidatus Yanofskybacteria bacterium RIFCSPHIGHO2_02_FULL_43_22 TaxID=1802681 RepID=A0A1F8FPL3_9BACT|nr:MAG: hypothetical protein A3J47_00490 [Candidatus Yanofskybacteria bacterium RIFCSPHIGHO2_02_FULL_43_22]